MNDHYREISGSPEESPAYEEAVERFTEALERLEPARDDEVLRDAWLDAVNQYAADLR